MKVSILKETFKTYFARFFSYLSLSLLYLTVVLLGFFASYFFLPLIAIALIFVFVPASFSLHFNIHLIRNGEAFSIINFFKGYGMYFTNTYRGGYNSIKYTLFTLLIFVGVSLAIAFPFMMVVVYSNEEVLKILLSDEMISMEQMSELLEKVLSNSQIELAMLIGNMVAGLLASLFYFHNHLKSSLVYVPVFEHGGTEINMAAERQFYGLQFKYFKSIFYKEYWKLIYIPIIVYVLGYLGGGALHYFLIGKEVTSVVAFSFMFAFTSLVFIYPLIVIHLDNIVLFHRGSFAIAKAQSVLTNINRIPLHMLSNEEMEIIKAMKDKAEDIIKNTKRD